jgi:hypothetical protein
MKWRVMVELAGSDGIVLTHEISTGGSDRADAGGWKTDPRRIGGSPCSGAGRGILPATTGLLSLSVATAAETVSNLGGHATRRKGRRARLSATA